MLSKLTIAVMVLITAGVSTAAYAGSPKGDFFSTVTMPSTTFKSSAAVKVPPQVKPPVYHYGEKPVQKWFATLDAETAIRVITKEEEFTLAQDFGDPPQLERVVKWTNTAGSVAKRYRALAKLIRAMPTPADEHAQLIVDYRQALADMYDDSASVLEAYIKPRPPARTQEELDEQLDRVGQHAKSVKQSGKHLAEMDSSLRAHFGVLPNRATDSLWAYVSRKPR